MEKSVPTSAANSYVLALIRAIERGPRRSQIDKHLAFYLDMEAPGHIHALLTAWAGHVVSQLRIGTFVMDDQAIHESFRLPVWIKDGRGPHADCERVRGQYREDVIVIGTEKQRGTTQIVEVERFGSVISDDVVAIDGPFNSSRGRLDEVLLWYHHHSGESSALDLAR